MMGSRTGLAALSILGAGLLAACSVGPRTPIESPASDDDLASSENDEDDGFSLPEAEWVTDHGGSHSSNSSSAKGGGGQLKMTRVGKAQIWVGKRAPWDALEEVKSSEATASTGSRWKLKKTVWVNQGYLHNAAFSADGQSVVTLSNQSGHLYRYNLGGNLLKEVALPGFKEFDDAAFTPLTELPDVPQVFVARPEGTSVVDLESGKIDNLDKATPGTDIAHASRPGLYGVSMRRTTPQSGELVLQWVDGDIALKAVCKQRPDHWALSSDGRHLAISYYPANEVEVIDLKEKKLVSTLELPKWGSAIDISPDGKLIALGGEKLVVATFPEGQVLAEDNKYDNNIDTVRFTPQGDLLLASAYDGKARSYALPADLATKKNLPKPQMLAHSGTANVYALGLTADGRSLVTSSGDKTLKIWSR